MTARLTREGQVALDVFLTKMEADADVDESDWLLGLLDDADLVLLEDDDFS